MRLTEERARGEKRNRAKVFIEARPKGRHEGNAIEDYVVEEEGDRVKLSRPRERR